MEMARVTPDERLETQAPPLILASASSSRRGLLKRAGIAASCIAAQVDETEIKMAMRQEGADALSVAETLAELKACRISQKEPAALVIGADQILTCGDVWFDKPVDMDQAAGHLRALSGRRHSLLTCVCVARGGRRIWHQRETANLTMRTLSDGYIQRYLGVVGEAALTSVGAYQLEGRGAQLFAKIEGDFFTILGLPLLPLMDFLRGYGVIEK